MHWRLYRVDKISLCVRNDKILNSPPCLFEGGTTEKSYTPCKANYAERLCIGVYIAWIRFLSAFEMIKFSILHRVFSKEARLRNLIRFAKRTMQSGCALTLISRTRFLSEIEIDRTASKWVNLHPSILMSYLAKRPDSP